MCRALRDLETKGSLSQDARERGYTTATGRADAQRWAGYNRTSRANSRQAALRAGKKPSRAGLLPNRGGQRAMMRQQFTRAADARAGASDKRRVLAGVDMSRRHVAGSSWRSGPAQAGVLRHDIGRLGHTAARAQRVGGYLATRAMRGGRGKVRF